jgi:hypothetical protein
VDVITADGKDQPRDEAVGNQHSEASKQQSVVSTQHSAGRHVGGHAHSHP